LNIPADHRKIRLGRAQVAQYLRDNGGQHGAAMGPVKQDGIWGSAKAGDLEALGQHVEDGADLNRRDHMGITPISWAAMAGQQAAVAWLLDKGAKVAAKNKDGVTPLYSAAIFAHAEIVELLLKEEVEINALDEDGKTALDSVSSAWNQETEGIYKYLDRLLKLKLDFKTLRQERPKVAKILRKNGAKLGKQLK
jgi:ankyrin repeat protein